MEECKYCNNNIKNYIKHKPQCQIYKKHLDNVINNILNEDYLNNTIINNKKSISDISINFDIPRSFCNLRLAYEFHISRSTSSCRRCFVQ